MARRVYVYDRELGCVREKTPWDGHNQMLPRNPNLATPMVMRDCYHHNEVVSPVDGTVLDSWSKVREHNKRNDVTDIGNAREPDVPKRDFTADLTEHVKTSYEKIEQNHPESLAMIEAAKTGPEVSDADRRI